MVDRSCLQLDQLRLYQPYHSENHCGFTDLTRFDGVWFLAFREGSTHMSLDGQIVILTSTHGVDWQVHSRLQWVGGDLRDPHFVINAQGALVLNAGIRLAVKTQPHCNVSSVGWVWCEPEQQWSSPVLDDDSACHWRWMPQRVGEWVYSVAYTGQARQGKLMRSADGLHWQPWVVPFFPDPSVYCNEASLTLDQDHLLCLLRCDQKGGCPARLGWAAPPFDDWQWTTLPTAIGGPKVITLSNGDMIAVYRVIDYAQKTARLEVAQLTLDVARKQADLEVLGTLPAQGDCSYAGMVEFERALWISYYASPNEKDETDRPSQVYVTRVPLAC